MGCAENFDKTLNIPQIQDNVMEEMLQQSGVLWLARPRHSLCSGEAGLGLLAASDVKFQLLEANDEHHPNQLLSNKTLSENDFMFYDSE